MSQNVLGITSAITAGQVSSQNMGSSATSSAASGMFAAMLTKAQEELQANSSFEQSNTNSAPNIFKEVDAASIMGMMMPGYTALDSSSGTSGFGGSNSELMMFLVMFLLLNQKDEDGKPSSSTALPATNSAASKPSASDTLPVTSSGKTVTVNGKTYEYPEFSGDVGEIVKKALTRLGDPYSREKAGSGDYTDCSYLSRWCYRALGIEIPRTAAEQARYCVNNSMTVSKDQLQPGDLIFFSLGKNGRYKDITHVGIYAGNGMMIDASSHYGKVVYRKVFDQGVVLYGRPK